MKEKRNPILSFFIIMQEILIVGMINAFTRKFTTILSVNRPLNIFEEKTKRGELNEKFSLLILPVRDIPICTDDVCITGLRSNFRRRNNADSMIRSINMQVNELIPPSYLYATILLVIFLFFFFLLVISSSSSSFFFFFFFF